MKAGKLVFAGTILGTLLFFAFALAFAIKVPLFPFHTWLPDAHTEAPTAGSVVLAAVMLKMGTYGLMRFNFTLFPEASREFAWLFITLAIIGIIYGALVAMVQPDIKRLVAYSSVSHMGFVILGMFSFTEQGMQGALYQMLNHGISTGALFLLVGFIYERRHTRAITEFGGVASVMPLFATFFVFTSMSSIGLPFLNGFVGEFLIMLGMWNSTALSITSSVNWNYVATMFAGTGVIFAAVYLLWMIQRVFLRQNHQSEKSRFERFKLARNRFNRAAAVPDGLYGRLPQTVSGRVAEKRFSRSGKSFRTSGGRND